MKVPDPNGQTWRVHRRWLPWNPKKRRVDESGFDILDVFSGVDDLAGAEIALGVGGCSHSWHRWP